MKTNRIVGWAIIACILVFGATLGANLVSDSIQDHQAEIRQQNLKGAIDRAQMLSIALDTKLSQFVTDHSLTAEDMTLFGYALSTAEPCNQSTDCWFVDEYDDSAEHNNVPYVASVSNGPYSNYRIIPVEEIRYRGTAGRYLRPRFTIYHLGRTGTVTKVTDSGQVSQNWCGGYECDWFEITDPDYGRMVRHNALVALNRN